MPEPILVAIAAAVAGKSVGTLYDLVKKKFAGRRTATEALAAAGGAAPNSPEVHAVAAELAEATAGDPEFDAALRIAWASVIQRAETGGVVNQISGTMSGNVVQARDIRGGVTFSG